MERELATLSIKASGQYAAALKVYMALAMFANFKPSPGAETAGLARLSFSELEALCDISRRYVSLALGVLKERQLIAVQNIGHANAYLLAGYDDRGWAKLPRGHLLYGSRFKGLGIRGALHLNAIKLYLALATFRPNSGAQVLLSYDKIQEYTGIHRPRIRRAIDVLLNHDWISVSSQEVAAGETKPANVYLLRGDFWGRGHRNYARASATAPFVTNSDGLF